MTTKLMGFDTDIIIPEFMIINAMDRNALIGDSKDNSIPWLKDKEFKKMYKWDMELFKNTTNYNPIIMGWKTMLSLKKPLNYRTNIVVSTRKLENVINTDDFVDVSGYKYEEYEDMKFLTDTIFSCFSAKYVNKFIVVGSLEEAMRLIVLANINNWGYTKAFIIGGAKLYEESLKKRYISNIITSNFDDAFEGDVYFPTEYLKEYKLYENISYNNGEVLKYEIVDPEYKERIYKTLFKEE